MQDAEICARVVELETERGALVKVASGTDGATALLAFIDDTREYLLHVLPQSWEALLAEPADKLRREQNSLYRRLYLLECALNTHAIASATNPPVVAVEILKRMRCGLRFADQDGDAAETDADVHCGSERRPRRRESRVPE